MPRDPRARVVEIRDEGKNGGYHFINSPEYGQGAYRDIVYDDGTVERRFVHLRSPAEIAQQGDLPPDVGYLLSERREAPTPDWQDRYEKTPPARTPEAEEVDKAKAAQAKKDQAESEANAGRPDGRYETNAERDKRLREEETAKRQQASFEQQTEAQRQANALAQARLGFDVTKYEDERGQPKFLSQSGTENPYITAFDPASGQIRNVTNPNYDRVKVEAERMRNMLATQIQARSVTLDEAKMQYQQWFDTNVKTPLMLSQEARDKAKEQREALDAEERRRQFAANFSLQKGELGQRAGAAAMSAEQSLLPYRAGPTEAAEMSSAINSLGAGGTLAGPSASAGINFTPGAFQFDAPDFKKIAKSAAKQALSGLTEYRPAEGEYQTADYSGVPAVNTGGAPGIPTGYGAFDDIINNLKSTYNFGGAPTP